MQLTTFLCEHQSTDRLCHLDFSFSLKESEKYLIFHNRWHGIQLFEKKTVDMS